MSEKRLDQIAVRVTPEMKRKLQEEANKLDWSVSKLAEKILSIWIQEIDKTGGAISLIIK